MILEVHSHCKPGTVCESTFGVYIWQSSMWGQAERRFIGWHNTVWVVKIWLPHTGELRIWEFLNPWRPDVSSAPIWFLNPEGFLESCWFLVCVRVLKKQVPLSVKECSSNRIDGLTRESQDKQAETKVSLFISLLSGLPLEDTAHIYGESSPNDLIKEIPHSNAHHLPL